MSKTISSNRTKGIICIILSALGFALMSACVKLAGDLPNFQKVFFRNLVSAIIALYLILKKDIIDEIYIWNYRCNFKLLCHR